MPVRLPDVKFEKDYDAELIDTNQRYEKLIVYWNTIKKKIIEHHESIKIESYQLCDSPDLEICFNIFNLNCFIRFKYHLINSRPGNSIIQYGTIGKNEETGKNIKFHIADVEMDDNGNIVCPVSEKGRISIDDYGKVHSFVLANIMECLAETTHDIKGIEEIDILEDWEIWEDLEGFRMMQ